MRVFANLFLILFLADGVFSFVDELVPLLTPLAPFTALRLFLAINVIVLAAAVYLFLGIDRRLPKRLFLPQIFFVFFVPLSGWLFPGLAEIRIYGLMAAAAQVVLGMLPLHYFRNGDKRSLTMPAKMFIPPMFSLWNSLAFTAASLIVIPLVLVIFGLSMVDSYMAGFTSGFMRLEPGGLKMTERIYQRGNRTVRLAAMIHVGDKNYYDALSASIVPGRTIVLAEGVSDNSQLLQNSLDYGKMAGFLGLTSQKQMHIPGRIIDVKELDQPARRTAKPGEKEKQPEQTDIVMADVDVSSFRPPTILLLNAVGKHMEESASFMKGFRALNSWGEKNLTPDMQAIVMDDILHRRNMVVIGYLDKALVRYDTIVIPWGALHMKELEAEVLKRGFKQQEVKERVSVDFRKMFLSTL